jgi:hypothetical protein
MRRAKVNGLVIPDLPPEEGAELHIVSGCASGRHVGGGAHYGISEFYVKKNAKISFTMIHTWGEEIEVYPRSASIVEEGGTFLSNYVCMQPVKKVSFKCDLCRDRSDGPICVEYCTMHALRKVGSCIRGVQDATTTRLRPSSLISCLIRSCPGSEHI